MRRSPPPRPPAPPLCAVAILVAATGCTMCPDPFDYSGPVPDGSAPQNDFRLRANGIVPVGSNPVPWPPVVRSEPMTPEATERQIVPTVAEAVGTVDDGDEVDGDDAPPAPEPPEAAAEPPLDEILPPTPPLRPAALPSLRETPGWKPRG